MMHGRASRVCSPASRTWSRSNGLAVIPAKLVPAKAGIHVLAADDLRPQVAPSRVRSFYQAYLPRPSPFLDPLLSTDRFFHVVVNLEVDQVMYPVAFGESFNEAVPVLPDTFDEIACHTNVQGAVRSAGQNVDGGLFRHFRPFRGFPLPAF